MLRFLQSVSYIYVKQILTHEKFIAVGKSGGPNATFNLFFFWVGLAWGWGVRRFHNHIYFEVYVFQPNRVLVYRRHQLTAQRKYFLLPFRGHWLDMRDQQQQQHCSGLHICAGLNQVPAY